MNTVDESLQFLSKVSALFRPSLDLLWSQYPNHKHDPWDALGVLLAGYAFERQGRNPDYAHVAADVISEMKRKGIHVEDAASPTLVWKEFCQRLDNKDLNENVNPLCPKGTEFKRKYKGTVQIKFTGKLSAIEVAANLVPTTITALAQRYLEADRATEAERQFRRINGMGSKIVSLFLRDIAIHFSVGVQRSARVLQPIDIHVRRISWELMEDRNAKDAKIAQWIVNKSAEAGVLAGDVNQGMWYFGSQIAGSRYHTIKALNDLFVAKVLVDRHIMRLSQVVENWKGQR